MCEHPHPLSDSLLPSCHHFHQPGQPEKHQSLVRTMASIHPGLGKGVVANSWQGNSLLKPGTTQILSRHTSNPAWEIPCPALPEKWAWESSWLGPPTTDIRAYKHHWLISSHLTLPFVVLFCFNLILPSWVHTPSFQPQILTSDPSDLVCSHLSLCINIYIVTSCHFWLRQFSHY